MEIHAARCVLGQRVYGDHLLRQPCHRKRLPFHQRQASHRQHHGLITRLAVLLNLSGTDWRCDDPFALFAILYKRFAR